MQQDPTINFKNMFVEYCIQLYDKRKPTIDRFLIAHQNVKVNKRKFPQSVQTYCELKNMVYEEVESKSEEDFEEPISKKQKFVSQWNR